jgi:hypothetical protein
MWNKHMFTYILKTLLSVFEWLATLVQFFIFLYLNMKNQTLIIIALISINMIAPTCLRDWG